MSWTPGDAHICGLSEVQYFILTVVSSICFSTPSNHGSGFCFCKSSILGVYLRHTQYCGVLYFLVIHKLLLI